MIEPVLTAYLSENLSSAVYYYSAPNNAQLPFVVIDLTGKDNIWAINTKGITSCEFDLNCYASTMLGASTLANSVRGLLESFKGDMGGTRITLSRIINEFDSEEPQTEAFAKTLSLVINYTGD